ncbi:hypothetical protein BH11PAT1_BH11PAT1_4180 [soil metagenome]
MTSFIIISKNPIRLQEQTDQLISEFAIDPLDITYIKREKDEKTEKTKQSLGISDVKRMQQKLYLKPMRSQTKAIILKEAELLTNEAQNALLKVLEEPPLHTIIILEAITLETFLPTILSRCQVLAVTHDETIISDKEEQQLTTQITTISSWGIGECLNLAEKLAKNKQEALQWLEKAILVARKLMLKQGNKNQLSAYPTLIRKLQATYTILNKTNANPRLALETVFLSLQKIN